MRKILILATIPLSIKAFSLDFMEYLREKGYEVEAAAGKGRESDQIKARGFKYHEIDIPRNISLVGDLKAFVELKKVLSGSGFDLVHTQTAKAGFIGRLAARKAGVKVIVHTAHDWPFHHLTRAYQRHLYLTLEKIASGCCDAVIVDTPAVKERGLATGVVSPEKLQQIYMGINIDRFRPLEPDVRMLDKESMGIGKDSIVIGAVSRLVPDKGLDIFMECARRIKDKGNMVFVIAGEGELKESLVAEAASSGMSDRFFFPGHLDDVVPCLNTFDIFCLPTLREGFGVVFAEAQACEVPVVASDIGPLKEVVDDGRTGLLARTGDPGDFVKKLTILLDKAKRERMGRRARVYIKERFSADIMNETTLELYKRLWYAKGVL